MTTVELTTSTGVATVELSTGARGPAGIPYSNLIDGGDPSTIYTAPNIDGGTP